MVSSLENNIISGLILVVGVLLFFLGVRTSSFVGTAIPLSMLLSFSVIRFVGFTMNMVVLGALVRVAGGGGCSLTWGSFVACVPPSRPLNPL